MRRWDVGPSPYATPPAHLVHSDAEDWVDARDIARHTFTVDCAAEPATVGHADCTFELERLAHARRNSERAAWLDGHGVPDHDQWRLWSGTPPRLRRHATRHRGSSAFPEPAV